MPELEYVTLGNPVTFDYVLKKWVGDGIYNDIVSYRYDTEERDRKNNIERICASDRDYDRLSKIKTKEDYISFLNDVVLDIKNTCDSEAEIDKEIDKRRLNYIESIISTVKNDDNDDNIVPKFIPYDFICKKTQDEILHKYGRISYENIEEFFISVIRDVELQLDMKRNEGRISFFVKFRFGCRDLFCKILHSPFDSYVPPKKMFSGRIEEMYRLFSIDICANKNSLIYFDYNELSIAFPQIFSPIKDDCSDTIERSDCKNFDNPLDYGKFLIDSDVDAETRIRMLRERFSGLKIYEIGAFARGRDPSQRTKESDRQWVYSHS